MNNRKQCVVTCVDGLISSGKSTLISELKKLQPHFLYVDEPLKRFTYFKTYGGEIISPLGLMYANNVESSAFQLYVLDVFDDILQELCDNQPKPGTNIILDRCLLSSLVFATTLSKQGFIPMFSFEYWLKKFNQVKDKHCFAVPNQFFFVRTDPKVCMERMGKRGREMETEYKDMLGYQQLLINTYDEVLPQFGVPIIHSTEESVIGRVHELENILL
jgi:deoxyadenosine/deoxycytidine kinase